MVGLFLPVGNVGLLIPHPGPDLLAWKYESCSYNDVACRGLKGWGQEGRPQMQSKELQLQSARWMSSPLASAASSSEALSNVHSFSFYIANLLFFHLSVG